MATPRKKSAAKSRSTKPAARSGSAAKPVKKTAPSRAALSAKPVGRAATAARPTAKPAPPRPAKAAAKSAAKPAAKGAPVKAGKPIAAPVAKPVPTGPTRVKLAPPGTTANRSKSAPKSTALKSGPKKGASRAPEEVRPIGMLPPQSVARTTHRPAPKAMTPKPTTPTKTPRPHDSSPEGAPRVTENDFKEFEERLLNERRRILKEMGHLETTVLKVNQRDSSGDLSGYSFHMADAGTDAMEREKAFLFASAEGRVLLEIDDALRRLYRGEYGVCESCGNPIARARLEVMPHARLCIGCKEKEEKEQRGAM